MRGKLVVAALVLSAGPAWADDLKDMQGVWQITSAELGAQKLPEEALQKMRLVIAGDNYRVTVGDVVDEGKLKVDEKAKPKAMDIAGKEGPNAGKTILAIFELNGDTMKVCYALNEGKRPEEFKAKGETPRLLAVYKRVKK